MKIVGLYIYPKVNMTHIWKASTLHETSKYVAFYDVHLYMFCNSFILKFLCIFNLLPLYLEGHSLKLLCYCRDINFFTLFGLWKSKGTFQHFALLVSQSFHLDILCILSFIKCWFIHCFSINLNRIIKYNSFQLL